MVNIAKEHNFLWYIEKYNIKTYFRRAFSKKNGGGNPEKNVILDVGGDRFIAKRRNLEKFPSTRLGKMMRAENLRDILHYCDEFTPGNLQNKFTSVTS